MKKIQHMELMEIVESKQNLRNYQIIYDLFIISEKEMDNLFQKENEEIKKDNKLAKALTYLQDLIKI